MQWNNSLKVLAISDTISVNRFEHLKRFFHVSNNQLVLKKDDDNYDPLYKVRPILDSVLINCHGLIQEECQSIDEQMVPTKARAPIRQYLPSKPYKWEFEIWSRCEVSGVLYYFDVYVGKSNDYDPDDANPNITLLRWLDSGLVQFISSFVGPEFGPTVRRWSGKEKKIAEVTCPEIVHQYNLHMGGVDKNDMLLSFYRLNTRTK